MNLNLYFRCECITRHVTFSRAFSSTQYSIYIRIVCARSLVTYAWKYCLISIVCVVCYIFVATYRILCFVREVCKLCLFVIYIRISTDIWMLFCIIYILHSCFWNKTECFEIHFNRKLLLIIGPSTCVYVVPIRCTIDLLSHRVEIINYNYTYPWHNKHPVPTLIHMVSLTIF